MYNKKMLKYLVAGTMVTSFSIIPATYVNASEEVEDNVTEGIPVTETDMTEDDFKEIESVTGFTNQQLFDALEEEGYKLTDIFTKEEIEYYKVQDKLRAGQTTIVTHNDGTATIYLSSAWTKVIKYTGGIGIGAVTTLLSNVGIGGLAGGISMAFGSLDSSRGIYITGSIGGNDVTGKVFMPTGWGYQ